MFSLGIVLFEMFHPFETAMERAHLLSDLKQNGVVPDAWAQANPQVKTLCIASCNVHDNCSAVLLRLVGFGST